MGLLAQMREVFFYTGAFLIAWSWALVYYAFAHVAVGQSPLQNQIGFGGQWRLNSLPVLVCQYFVVCGFAAATRALLKGFNNAWAASLAVAIEFFPSPIFSGALMGYLGQFASHSEVEYCGITVVATWVTAALVYSVPTSGPLSEFGDVMQKTVGFGLGVAWNSFVSAAMPATWSFHLHTLFLVLEMSLAASLVVPEPGPSSLRQRHASLLSFAAKVVCAFSMASWINSVTPDGWLGGLIAELYLILQAASLSYWVSGLDLDSAALSTDAVLSRPDALERLVSCLVMIPCVWCCCPCVPLIWLLSRPHAGVKGRWLSLISEISSLAASVVGTNLLTGGIDALADAWHICGPYSCDGAVFLLLAAVGASLVSILLLTAIVPLCAPPALPFTPTLADARVALVP
ncbi:unnamed protein product [Prorocentrum cordatum]|uniref:Uncharacterized protein n=1 Tax=Prorocentrum cordatum TaxID=2364126 RepID=A0ABN9TA99_9DINO|nr:unnamed protein product [Polarella glacialis]|mmetsp:Transcript_104081/g.294549  ORF Transcript_104081/g.294549 Transcript_104081/m.294549 type:complete len:402 (+) Transcript_104081:107-1312(+)